MNRDLAGYRFLSRVADGCTWVTVCWAVGFAMASFQQQAWSWQGAPARQPSQSRQDELDNARFVVTRAIFLPTVSDKKIALRRFVGELAVPKEQEFSMLLQLVYQHPEIKLESLGLSETARIRSLVVRMNKVDVRADAQSLPRIPGLDTGRNEQDVANESGFAVGNDQIEIEREAREILRTEGKIALGCRLEYGAIVNQGLEHRLSDDAGWLAGMDRTVRQAMQKKLGEMRADYEDRMFQEMKDSLSRLTESLTELQRSWLTAQETHFVTDFDLYRIQLRSAAVHKDNGDDTPFGFRRPGYFHSDSFGYLSLEPIEFFQFPPLAINWVASLPVEAIRGKSKFKLIQEIDSLADEYVKEVKRVTSLAILTNTEQMLGSKNVLEAVRLTEERYTKSILELLDRSLTADALSQFRQRLRELEFQSYGVPGILAENRFPDGISLTEAQQLRVSEAIGKEIEVLASFAADIQREIVDGLGRSLETGEQEIWKSVFGESDSNHPPMPQFLIRKPD